MLITIYSRYYWVFIEFYKRSNCQSNLVPGVLSRRKGENPGNAVVAITRTIPRDWNLASRNNAQTNRSHKSPSDQSLTNCHGKLDKHFTPKLYVCWILHGIKWLCLETFLSTFFSLLFSSTAGRCLICWPIFSRSKLRLLFTSSTRNSRFFNLPEN